jgi:hypothetical protein
MLIGAMGHHFKVLKIHLVGENIWIIYLLRARELPKIWEFRTIVAMHFFSGAKRNCQMFPQGDAP